mmetsp:Transcript_13463/g.21057  ORF Transcript_13463/g.21057 Transcript_13463/m.21057 type:complete len:261 (+) Transcript_13463:244-1026(+)
MSSTNTSSHTDSPCVFPPTTQSRIVYLYATRRILKNILLHIGKNGLMGGYTLKDHTSGGHHGKATVLDLLECVVGGLLGGGGHLQRVEAVVPRSTVAGLAALGDGQAGDNLNNEEAEEAAANIKGVILPHLPEHIHLGLASGIGETGEDRAVHGGEEDASASKHGNTTVLELRLTHPIKVKPDVLDLRKLQWIETIIASHGTIQVLGLGEERHGLAHLGHHGHLGGTGRYILDRGSLLESRHTGKTSKGSKSNRLGHFTG